MAFPNFGPSLIISGSLLPGTGACNSFKYLATLRCKSQAAIELCAHLLCIMCTHYNILSAIRIYNYSLFFTAMFKIITMLINIILLHTYYSITQLHAARHCEYFINTLIKHMSTLMFKLCGDKRFSVYQVGNVILTFPVISPMSDQRWEALVCWICGGWVESHAYI